MTVKKKTLLPMNSTEGLNKNLGSRLLPFASPSCGDIIVLSVSFLLHDAIGMKSKTEVMMSERRE